MNNPLLETSKLRPISAIAADQIRIANEKILQTDQERIEHLLATVTQATWDNFMAAMQAWDDELSQAWSAVGHLNGVLNSDELREAYNACLPLLSQYSTELGQNQALCELYKKLEASEEFNSYSVAQKKAVTNALRDFHLGGVDLSAE